MFEEVRKDSEKGGFTFLLGIPSYFPRLSQRAYEGEDRDMFIQVS